MVRILREQLVPATVKAADALGWSADAIETQVFGFLAAGVRWVPVPDVSSQDLASSTVSSFFNCLR
jgi:1,6-anhydro-N-acetylmuramate kinase